MRHQLASSLKSGGRWRPPPSRRLAVDGALMPAGVVFERWSVFRAGFQSASDPKYTVMPQRERLKNRGTNA